MTLILIKSDARYIPLADESVQMVVTSPPYWGLRDYGLEPLVWRGDTSCRHEWFKETHLHCGAWLGCLGLEPTPDLYIQHLVEIFREVRRVLRKDGTVWLNMGDSYAANRGSGAKSVGEKQSTNRGSLLGKLIVPDGLKPKDLIGIPWRVALALQADGWWLRSDIIWSKPNPMPESVKDRPTRSHDYVFLLTKSARYFFNQDAVRETAITKGLPSAESMRGKGWNDHTQDLEKGRRFDEKSTHKKAVPEQGRNLRSVWTIPTQPFSGWQETVRLARVELDDVCDDTICIKSPFCPIHGNQDLHYDEHAIWGTLSHIEHTDSCPALKWLFSSAYSSMIHDSQNQLCMLGYLNRACFLSATQHNIENRKKAPVLLTNAPCISFFQNLFHTAGMSKLLSITEQIFHSHVSNTLVAAVSSGKVICLLAQMSCRIEDTDIPLPIPPECVCLFYQRITEKTSHFATFPEALADRCIKAGSKPGDIVLDPFGGSGTTARVAVRLGRRAVHCDLAYHEMARSSRCTNIQTEMTW